MKVERKGGGGDRGREKRGEKIGAVERDRDRDRGGEREREKKLEKKEEGKEERKKRKDFKQSLHNASAGWRGYPPLPFLLFAQPFEIKSFSA